ncbi:hypothetical protein B0H16DRAFT_1769630 [Mycena metata]|uniref:Uncharacterized protein n=1 Tax=Mycena metata TaxID=1033252 RepID=A0AAD7MUH8_9AGAR|nr:hypothetical protein B0H16DRAFT_1769630 [Mycena metata]
MRARANAGEAGPSRVVRNSVSSCNRGETGCQAAASISVPLPSPAIHTPSPGTPRVPAATTPASPSPCPPPTITVSPAISQRQTMPPPPAPRTACESRGAEDRHHAHVHVHPTGPYRDEDVLLSLQLLACLSKYPHIRVKDAKKSLKKYKRIDVAVDAYYSDPTALAARSHTRTLHGPSTSKINAVFDKYKGKWKLQGGRTVFALFPTSLLRAPRQPDDGTVRLVNPEDVVLLAVAYELESPCVGEWRRPEWLVRRADDLTFFPYSLRLSATTTTQYTIPPKAPTPFPSWLPRLHIKLTSNAAYFTKVYNETFEFARAEGQRSIDQLSPL